MKQTSIPVLLLLIFIAGFAGKVSSQPYQPAPTKVNDLVHTKLQVSFDYKKCYLYGEAWITLTPHCYPVDSLQLDAKGMDINNIYMMNGNKKVPLQYSNDGLKLHIALDRTYHAT